ncbi:MAG: redoxin domain-containing protein [Bacteroidia bacterium]
MMFLKALLFVLTLISLPLVRVELKNLDGQKTRIQQFDQYKASVLWFISPDCPLCQNYTLTIKKIQEKYGKQIRIIGIVSGKQTSIQDIKKFKKEYQIDISVLLDEEMKLCKLLGASITPEVFVFNKKQELVYSGRIDNWAYALGRKRTVITQHELDDVLGKLCHNQEVSYFKTKAVGCFIE